MKLLYLLSLPRSGSTLLQRMLGTHPRIATAGEPNLLYPLGWFLQDGVQLSTAYPTIRANLRRDLAEPHLHAAFQEGVHALAENYYRALAGRDADIFLDKSPAYAGLARALCRTLPHDHFVVLWRNPLAIAASMLRYRPGGEDPVGSFAGLNWFHLSLQVALDELCQLARQAPPHVSFVRFEDLVTLPTPTLQQVCAGIGIEFLPSLVTSFAGWQIDRGDPDRRKADRQRVNPAIATKWVQFYHNPLRRAWARAYLAWLGPERLALMGYDSAEVHRQLAAAPTRRGTFVADAYWITRARAERLVELEVFRSRWRARRHHLLVPPVLPQVSKSSSPSARPTPLPPQSLQPAREPEPALAFSTGSAPANRTAS